MNSQRALFTEVSLVSDELPQTIDGDGQIDCAGREVPGSLPSSTRRLLLNQIEIMEALAEMMRDRQRYRECLSKACKDTHEVLGRIAKVLHTDVEDECKQARSA